MHLRRLTKLDTRRPGPENRARPRCRPQLSPDAREGLNIEWKLEQDVQEAPGIKDRETNGVVDPTQAVRWGAG